MVERKVLEWFVNGRVGISSRAMAAAALGIENTRGEWDDHPHDPDDLNRCLKLLQAVPEIRQGFAKVAARSPVWAALIERWDEIENCFLDEAGLDWCKAMEARKTYDLMRGIIDSNEMREGKGNG